MFEMHLQMLASTAELGTCAIWTTDLDNTVFEDNMSVVVRHFIGDLKTEFDRQLLAGEISHGKFLKSCVEAMAQRASAEEIIACCLQHARLMPYFADFRNCLSDHGIGVLGLTNNIAQHTRCILKHLGVDFPVVGNELDASGNFHAVHEDFGLNKSRPINWLVNHGHVVVGFAGDSANDIEGAKAVHALDSTVVVIGDGNEGLNKLARYRFENYQQLIPLIPSIIERAERAFARL